MSTENLRREVQARPEYNNLQAEIRNLALQLEAETPLTNQRLDQIASRQLRSLLTRSAQVYDALATDPTRREDAREVLEVHVAKMLQTEFARLATKNIRFENLDHAPEVKLGALNLPEVVKLWVQLLDEVNLLDNNLPNANREAVLAIFDRLYFHPAIVVMPGLQNFFQNWLRDRNTRNLSVFDEEEKDFQNNLVLTDNEFIQIKAGLADPRYLVGPNSLANQAKRMRLVPKIGLELPKLIVEEAVEDIEIKISDLQRFGRSDDDFFAANAQALQNKLTPPPSPPLTPLTIDRINTLKAGIDTYTDIHQDRAFRAVSEHLNRLTITFDDTQYSIAHFVNNVAPLLGETLHSDPALSDLEKQGQYELLLQKLKESKALVNSGFSLIDVYFKSLSFGYEQQQYSDRFRKAYAELNADLITSIDRASAAVSLNRSKVGVRPDARDYGRPPLPDMPTNDDYEAWVAWYFEVYHLPDGKLRFKEEVLDESIIQLQYLEWDDRDKFTGTDLAEKFVRLDRFLRTDFRTANIGASRRQDRVDYYEKELKNDHDFLWTFLRMNDITGPYGQSILGDADFLGWIKESYPEFGLDKLRWLVAPEGENRWKFADEARRCLIAIQHLMVEVPGSQAYYLDSSTGHLDIKAKTGYFSYINAYWGGPNDDFRTKLKERLLGEAKAQKDGLPTSSELMRWLTPGKEEHYRKEDLDIIVSRMFETYQLLTARNTEFLRTIFGWGGSPPPFFNFKDLMEIYPLMKQLNQAKKTPIEIPAVVLGLEVDRYWIMQSAFQRKVFEKILSELILNEDVSDEELGNLRAFQPSPPGQPQNPLFELITRPLYELINPQIVDIEDIEKVLWIIADDEGSRSIEAYNRFRSIIRSIFFSEARADLLGLKHTRHMHFTDAFGYPTPMVKDRHGNEFHQAGYPAPLVLSPIEMLLGAESSFFSKKEYRLDLHYPPALEKTHELHEAVYHKDLPKLSGASSPGKHTEDINLLWDDFQKCLDITSPLRAVEAMVNWAEIAEMYEDRLRMLFATYKRYYPDHVPSRPYDVDLVANLGHLSRGDNLRNPQTYSLAGLFIHGIALSGQTVSDASVSLKKGKKSRISLPYPYDHRIQGLDLKQYLIALIDSKFDDPAMPYHNRLTPQEQSRVVQGLLNGIYARTNRADIRILNEPLTTKGRNYRSLSYRWRAQATVNEQLIVGGDAHAKAVKEQKEEADDTKKNSGKKH